MEKNRVIHGVIHIIHKKEKKRGVYILENFEKIRTCVLEDCDKVEKIAKKMKK